MRTLLIHASRKNQQSYTQNVYTKPKTKPQPKKGKGHIPRHPYKLTSESTFGDPYIDPMQLANMRLEAYKGDKVISRKIDANLSQLLTKRFKTNKAYSDGALESWNKQTGRTVCMVFLSTNDPRSTSRKPPRSSITSPQTNSVVAWKSSSLAKKRVTRVSLWTTRSSRSKIGFGWVVLSPKKNTKRFTMIMKSNSIDMG